MRITDIIPNVTCVVLKNDPSIVFRASDYVNYDTGTFRATDINRNPKLLNIDDVEIAPDNVKDAYCERCDG